MTKGENMREIKFRGKIVGAYIGNDPQNKWFYGSLVKELSTGKTYILDVSHTDKGEARFNTLGLEVDPNTVGQFTGLLDKNGKEIYEGDILLEKRENRVEKTSFNKAVVLFVLTGWEAKYIEITTPRLKRQYIEYFGYSMNTLEVIGSIHD